MKQPSLNRPEVIVPIVTPFDPEARIDYGALKVLFNALIAGGADAIFVGGSAGSGPLLTDRDWRELMTFALDAARDKIALMAGVIETSPPRAAEKIRFLGELGYETVVVTPPFYVPLERPAEFLRYFGACREAGEMDMIAYNIPCFVGSAIPVEVLAETRRRGWFRALKESSGDRPYFEAVLAAGKESDMPVYQGCERDIAWGLRLGAAGVVPVCANFAPALFAQIARAAAERDWVKVDTLQQEIDQYIVRYVKGDGSENWIGGVTRRAAETLGLKNIGAMSPFGRQ